MKKILILLFTITIGLLFTLITTKASSAITPDAPNQQVKVQFADEYSGANVVYEYQTQYLSNVLGVYYDYTEYIDLEQYRLVSDEIEITWVSFGLYMDIEVLRSDGYYYFNFENDNQATVSLTIHYFDDTQYFIPNFKYVQTYTIPTQNVVKRIVGVSVSVRQYHLLYVDYDNDYISHHITDDESGDHIDFNVKISNWFAMFNEYYEAGYDDGTRDSIGFELENAFEEGRLVGFQEGLDATNQEAFDAGYLEGSKNSFLASIDKWIVPAIFIVIVVGGFFALRGRREY